MNPLKLFTRHPASVGESYLSHLGHAMVFALRIFGAGAACLLHAFFPFWCVTTGSDKVATLYREMSARREFTLEK